MIQPDFNLGVFVLTYLVHSTLAIVPALMLRSQLRRWLHPELRVQIWKLLLIVPVFTALGVAFFELPHYGAKISLAQLGVASPQQYDADPMNDRFDGLPASNYWSVLQRRMAQLDSPWLTSAFPDTEASAAQRRRTDSTNAMSDFVALPFLGSGLPWFWAMGIGLGALALCSQFRSLHKLCGSARLISSGEVFEALERIRKDMGIHREVRLLASDRLSGPVTSGWIRPLIIMPAHLTDENGNETLPVAERDALLAHELAHVARGDAGWNWVIQVVRWCFFFQPLNYVAGKQLRKEMDFVADLLAVDALNDRMSLSSCLLRIGEHLKSTRSKESGLVLVSGMAAFRSTLGQRVETLLEPNQTTRPLGNTTRCCSIAVLVAAAILFSTVVPQAIAKPNQARNTHSLTHQSSEKQKMKTQVGTLALLTALSMPVVADDSTSSAEDKKPAKVVLKTTPDKLPASVKRFNGMVVGRLAAKDIERGTFVVNVDTVSRVWRNSLAENPQALVGKAIQVGGVSGEWLDVLVTTRNGETIEFECSHDGDRLRFPGELMRKVAPYKPEDYPRLPESFRGFRGTLVADVIKKDSESREMIVQVSAVTKVSSENKAKDPKSIEGRRMLLAGFWNREELLHNLKPGDRIESGVRHISRQSNHVEVEGAVRKIDQPSTKQMMKK